MAYLNGENIKPANNAEAKKLIGKRVQYLRSTDIDRSGRGYIFPRTGTIVEVVRRNIDIDGNMVHLSDIVEMVELVS
ncbi:hypothetical protein ACFVS2_26680 [Brevibacillus sp. NPDC058079]|uniref:hypothetical protein n=1 Tax=Brevibacillus sp. NPDC058079 TaxID=3346330 RepID=UPI0036E96B21